MSSILVGTVLLCSAFARGEEPSWRVGLARARITPEEPLPMVGYGPRVSDGVLDDLQAKAMVLESSGGQRAVLVTADLLFFRAAVAEAIARKITEKTGLARHQILLNTSHTHSGPQVGVNDDLESFGVPESQRPRVAAYTARLEEQLGNLAAAAVADLRPARLGWGVGQIDFVVNRRAATPGGIVMRPNPDGHVDRTVPVLRIDDLQGRLRGLVFGCACHPVTLDGDNRKISGDYAGLAQHALQMRHPGVQAMFVSGCGADANSHPRGSHAIAREQAERLAAEVSRVATGPLRPVRGPLQPALQWIDLPLEQGFSRKQLEDMARGPSIWHARSAKGLLALLDRNQPLPTHYRAPLALWQFGRDLTLIALPGEAVSEYVPLIRQALGPKELCIAAYANDGFGYLPTARILKEGGHESMCLTLDIGIFSPAVEATVVGAVRDLAADSSNAGANVRPVGSSCPR